MSTATATHLGAADLAADAAGAIAPVAPATSTLGQVVLSNAISVGISAAMGGGVGYLVSRRMRGASIGALALGGMRSIFNAVHMARGGAVPVAAGLGALGAGGLVFATYLSFGRRR
jgi:hypothetical protein